MTSPNFYDLSEGEISVSLEQEAIHIKAVDKFGDPVELTKKKALELSIVLKQLAEKISE